MDVPLEPRAVVDVRDLPRLTERGELDGFLRTAAMDGSVWDGWEAEGTGGEGESNKLAIYFGVPTGVVGGMGGVPREGTGAHPIRRRARYLPVWQGLLPDR